MPLCTILLFLFQQALLSLANQLALSIMVAEAVCGDHNGMFKTKLLSTTLFMDSHFDRILYVKKSNNSLKISPIKMT
jgi:hypothetical protein